MYEALMKHQFDNILQYIPHRPPFLMVDKLVSVSDTSTVSNFVIKEDNLFCENGYFYEGGLIENIAQTVAAGAGYRMTGEDNKNTIGMIGSIKKLSIARRPSLGEVLETGIKLITEFENALVVEGTVLSKNEIIAQCQMNIFILKNINEKQL
jgi:3-hydroxyacyl-[acyl-carrier-protein] dehydratase